MKGNIINIGPAYGQIRHPQSAPYVAAMEAVLVMTQALALEMAAYHVTVNTLWPGLAASEAHWAAGTVEAESQGISLEQTQALEVKQIPLGRYVGGHDLAGAILWLSSESGANVTGQLIHVNGGLNIA